MRSFRQSIVPAVVFIFGLLNAQIFPIRHITTKDGLVSNAVISMAQDHLGRIWIGTDEGVSIYDGFGFTNLTIANGLSNSRINILLPGTFDSSIVWLGTNGGGLDKYSDGHLISIALSDKALPNSILSLCEDGNGTLYCGTAGELFAVTIRSNTFHTVPFFHGKVIDGIYTDSEHAVDVLIHNELFKITDSTVERIHDFSSSQYGDITASSSLGNNGVIFGTAKGWILIWKQGSITRALHPTGNSINALDGTRSTWYAGSDGGLYEIDLEAERVQHLGKENGLLDNSLNDCMVDKDGSLWIAHYGTGVSFVRSFAAQKFDMAESYNTPNGSSASSDSHNHIWICSKKGLLEWSRDLSGEWTHYTHSSIGSFPLEVVSLFIDKENHFWAADTAGNIMRIEPRYRFHRPTILSVRQFYKSGDALPHAGPLIIFEDSQKRIWCSCGESNGVAVISPGQKKIIRLYQQDGIPDNSIRAIAETDDGSIWLGGYDGGLCSIRFSGTSYNIINYSSQMSTGEHAVRAIIPFDIGSLYIGTRYRGIVKFHAGSFVPVPISESGIWCGTITSDKTIVFGTQQGLLFVNNDSVQTPPSLREFVDEPVFSVGTLPDSSLWATTHSSLVVYKDDFKRHHPPIVWLGSFEIDGEKLSPADPIELPYNKNTVSIQLNASSVWSGKNMWFQWRFANQSERWSKQTVQRTLTFASLGPGTYDLEVRAIDFDGNISQRPATASFIIDLPYWRTWWFILLAAAAIAGLAGGVVWLKASQLLEIERLRSRIAGDLHDEIGSGLTRIALLSEVVKKQTGKKRRTPDDIRQTPELLETVQSTAQQLVESLGDVVWSLDTGETTMTHLLQRFTSFAGEIFEAKGIGLHLNIQKEVYRVTLAQERLSSLLLFLKEAVTNIVRHSGAEEASIEIRFDNGFIMISITDNGRGFQKGGHDGNGLRTMQRRIERCGGTFDITSVLRSGTTISARIPAGSKTA